MTQSQDYQQEPKNARAVCQAMAWLSAVGIPCRLPEVKSGADLILTKKDGGEINIKLAVTQDEPRPAVECLVVLAKELASPQAPVALAAFHVITEAAGFGRPLPVDRGPEPEKKLSYHDNFELVSLRHREFRRVPNPDPVELAGYKKVMEQACYRFVNMNQELCRRNCLLVEDLMTYAQVWTCNYLGLYKVAVETVNDNIRKLRAHLKQRFAEFAKMIQKKERDCFPAPDTVHIALLGKPIDENHRLESFSIDPTLDEGVDTDYIKRHSELDLSNDDTRRNSAVVLLAKNLKSMPHDKMIQVLTEAAANNSLCADARSEANRQLRLHERSCNVCIQENSIEQIEPVVGPVVVTVQQATKPILTGTLDEQIEAAKASFIASADPINTCFRCKKVFPISVRLMNRPKLLNGVDTMPKFLVQSRCSPCRRSEKKVNLEL